MLHTFFLRFASLAMFLLWACLSAKAQYSLQGSAISLGKDCYRITDNTKGQNGTVWYTDKIDLAGSFDIEFTMNFGTGDEFGADGMVFVLQSQGSRALGLNGEGIGFQGFLPSLGIEFDTYQNQVIGDPVYDHIGVHRDGNISHLGASTLVAPVQASASNQNIEDGKDHLVRINWIAPRKLFEVYFDCSKRISLPLDMRTIFKNQTEVYWGFTGATGLFVNKQSVCLKKDIVSRSLVQACEGESVELLARPAPDGKYSWSPTTGLSNPTVRNPTSRLSSSQLYVVQHLDNCGIPIRDSIQVKIAPRPELELGGDQSLCGIDSLQLQPQRAPAGSSILYQWSTGDTTRASTVYSTGMYSLVLRSGNCSVKDSVSITLQTEPQSADPNLYPLVCLRDQPVRLTSMISGTGLSYSWVHSGGTGNSVEVDQKGTYELVVTNQEGCQTSEVFVVTDSCAAAVWIPDAFTPNADGHNDRLVLHASEAVDLRFWVFNRWGVVVFYSEDSEPTWDGYYQGVLCSPDAYTWKAEYRPRKNPTLPYFVKGGVALLIR